MWTRAGGSRRIFSRDWLRIEAFPAIFIAFSLFHFTCFSSSLQFTFSLAFAMFNLLFLFLGAAMSSGGVLAVAAVKFGCVCAGELCTFPTRLFFSARADFLHVLVVFSALVVSVRASPATIPEGCEFYAVAEDAGRLCCPLFSASIDRGKTIRTWSHVTEPCGVRFPHLLAASTASVAPVVGWSGVWTWRVACVAGSVLVAVLLLIVGLRCLVLCRRRARFSRTDLLPGYVRAQMASSLLSTPSAPDFSSCKIAVGSAEPDVEEELGYLAVRFDALDRRVRGGGLSRFASSFPLPAQDRSRQPGFQECAPGNCGTGGSCGSYSGGDFETLTSATSTFCDTYVLPPR